MEYVKKTKEGKMEKWHLQEEQGVPRKVVFRLKFICCFDVICKSASALTILFK